MLEFSLECKGVELQMGQRVMKELQGEHGIIHNGGNLQGFPSLVGFFHARGTLAPSADAISRGCEEVVEQIY